MASVEVLSAKIAHDATLEPMNKPEETTEEAVTRNPPPPPPPVPSEKKQTDSETKESDDVAPEPETLAIAMETKAVIATEPVEEKKVAGASNKVAPEPVEEKIEDTAAEVAPAAEEPVVGVKKDEDEKEVGEKVSPQAKVEKKEE